MAEKFKRITVGSPRYDQGNILQSSGYLRIISNAYVRPYWAGPYNVSVVRFSKTELKVSNGFVASPFRSLVTKDTEITNYLQIKPSDEITCVVKLPLSGHSSPNSPN